MTNTLLTLHDPAVARRYYAEGLWRRDTLYTLLCDHAARRPEAFAVREGSRRLTWGELRAHGRCGRRRSRRGRAEARRAGRGLAAEPGRGGRDPARLLAPGLCLQPVAAPELHGRRDRRAAVAHPRRGVVRRSPAMAPTRDTADIFAAAAALPSLRRVYTLGGLARATRRRFPQPRWRPPLPAGRRRPRQDRLSRLHLGHDRRRRRASCIRTTPCSPTAARWSRTGITTSARSC